MVIIDVLTGYTWALFKPRLWAGLKATKCIAIAKVAATVYFDLFMTITT